MSDRAARPILGLQRPQPDGLGLAFVLIDAQLYGFDTHYLDGRVHVCTLPLGTCLPCRQGFTPRFRGFCAAMRAGSAGRYVVQVTPAVWRDCADLRRLDGQLAGRRFWIKRLTASPQATVQWLYEARTPELVKCGPVDTLSVLSRIWGLDLRALHQLPNFDGDLRPMLQPYPVTERRRRR